MNELSIKTFSPQNIMLNFHLLAIWNNPIVWKNFKSRFRLQSLFHLLLVFIIAAFMTLTIFSGVDRFEADPVQAARAGILPLGIFQWLILVLSGTGRISSGIIHERVTGTIDYTRLTPMSPMTKLLGYLFGLPVREYIAFAITMPFMIFLLIRVRPWPSPQEAPRSSERCRSGLSLASIATAAT